MSNDSSTGGFLSPVSTSTPVEGKDLQDFFHGLLVGVTGLSAQSVIPSWQANPQNLLSGNWLAFRFSTRKTNQSPYITHDGSGNGSSTVTKWEEIDFTASFYGDLADYYAGILADGLMIGQNRDALFTAGVALTKVGEAKQVPVMIKELWVYKVDLELTFTRQVQRTYPILNVQTVDFSVDTESITLTTTV